jgi:hypothetical protein
LRSAQIAAFVAVVAAILSGIFAWMTKGREGRMNKDLKTLEARVSLAKDLLSSDISAQRAALLDIRQASTKAELASTLWVSALFDGHREKETEVAVFHAADEVILRCAGAPLPYRTRIEGAAQTIRSALNNILQTAREDASYSHDEDLCGKASHDIGNAEASLRSHLDSWETDLRVKHDGLVEALRKA